MSWSDTLGARRIDRPAAPCEPRPAPTGGTPYGRRALLSECTALASTAEGGRNAALNRAAYAAGQLVAGGELEERDATESLTSAARQCGLGDGEIAKTLASGLAAGRSEPRQAPPRVAPRALNGHAPGGHGGPPDDDFGPVDYDAEPADAPRQLLTIASVLDGWRAEGPLVHEPTGIARLDELTGGGPVYGTRWYLAGAPDAGKTALLVQIAHEYAARGITVGLLAVDEDPGDLVTRLVQRIGYARHVAELRPHRELDAIGEALGQLPIRIYDGAWTVEAAADDLVRAADGGRAMLGIDSLQTVRCAAEDLAALAGREMSEVAAVTARVQAIRAAATTHRLIAMATSELGRGAYRSRDADQQTSTLAAAKWSGAVEYSARVLIGLRSVAGESDLIDLEIAKNKHGPRDEHLYLRIDRRCQVLTGVDYAPAPALTPSDRDGAARDRVTRDAVDVARVLMDRPGIGVRELRAAVRAGTGIGHERVDAAVSLLGSAVARETQPRNRVALSLDVASVPECVRHALGVGHE